MNTPLTAPRWATIAEFIGFPELCFVVKHSKKKKIINHGNRPRKDEKGLAGFLLRNEPSVTLNPLLLRADSEVIWFFPAFIQRIVI